MVSASGGTLTYTAAPGEANLMNVSLSSGVYTVVDGGAGVLAGTGCSVQSPGRATCGATGVGSIRINAGDGNDAVTMLAATPATIDDGAGDDLVTAGSGADVLTGAPGNDTYFGGAGNDQFDGGGSGADTFSGGTGTDRVSYASRASGVAASIDDAANDGTAGEGDNVRPDVENLQGGQGADALTGSSAGNALDGLAGDDAFRGGGGADVFAGGTGQDTADYSDHSSGVTVDDDGVADDGAPGESDNVGTDVENVIGTPGDDRITGSGWLNVLYGEGGDDVLSGRDGGDALHGGPGSDVLGGDSGDDTLDGGSGADRLNGGSGNDTADYSSRGGGVSVSLDDQWNDGQSGEGDDVASDVDRVLGGADSDRLSGDGDANTLNGNGGDDRIEGGGGRDQLDGGTGDDVLDGGSSSDTLGGGEGRDLADYSSRGGSVTVDLDNNSDDGEGGERDNVHSDVEDVAGGSGNDRLMGDDSGNTLSGGEGDDSLDGRGAGDTLVGGPGSDTADYSSRWHPVTVTIGGGADDGEPGEGDDVLGDVEGAKGGSAADTLVGDAGANTLSGNGGDDLLTGGGGPDRLNGGSGSDTVDFFDRGEPVRVDLDENDDSDGDRFGDDVENARGGWGNDLLIGGGGRNALDGGAGDDVLDGRGGADRLVGGPGADTADYSRRGGSVKVSLDGQPNDGERGEYDIVELDVENAIGGTGRDELTGGGGPNRLDGGPGNDMIDGGPGADLLLGGVGNDDVVGSAGLDTIDAGAGNDTIDAVDGKKDIVGCGTGRDRASTDKADKKSSCELKGKAGDMPASPTPGKPTSPGTPTGVKIVRGRGKFVGIPGFPGERIDNRVLRDVAWMHRKYHVMVTDGFALQGHEPHGEHPIGLAVDLVPGPGGSWSDMDRLAKWAEPRQKHPRAPFRWVGYNGDAGHGRGNHLHLSWTHAPSRRGHPAKWVEVLSFRDHPVVRPFGPLDGLSRSSNSAIGHAPSVKTGLPTARACSGSASLRATWKSAAKAFHLNWKILAAITQIESGLGCNMGPSSAGAVGWTQFMPATWRQWGMDANGDRHASPYNSVDAIFSSARYLRANGAPGNYHRAIFAYNHADWYVRQVLGLSHRFKPVTPLSLQPELQRAQTVLP